MKSLLFILYFCTPFLLFCQNLDSPAHQKTDSLLVLTRDLIQKRNFEKALEINTSVEKELIEKSKKRTVAYADVCRNFGSIYTKMGNYSKAVTWRQEAKTIIEKVHGKEHTDYAEALRGLGDLYRMTGNYEEAEKLLLEAMTIQEKASGKESAPYAACLNGLGILYRGIGDYKKAEFYSLATKTARGKIYGKIHESYAGAVINLGSFYSKIGNYEKAEALFLEAKEIFEDHLNDREHPFYLNCLNNMAMLYGSMQEFEKAEQYHLETKTIRGKVLGKTHPHYGASLNNLGALYFSKGEFEKAEPLFLEANLIWEKVLGKEHPYYAGNLASIANCYRAKGEYDKAITLFLESLDIWEKTLGTGHPHYSSVLSVISTLYKNKGECNKAEPFCREYSTLNQASISKSLFYLSEQELGEYLRSLVSDQNNLFSITQNSTSEGLRQLCYDNILFFKGFLLHTSKEIKRLALLNPTTQKNFELLTSCKSSLADEYVKPALERNSSLISDLENKSNDLQKELARSVEGFGKTKRQVKWQEVQQQLKEGEAAIEFVRYKYAGRMGRTDSIQYAALLLLPENQSPQFFPLFEEKQLDHLLKTQSATKDRQINQFYTFDKNSDASLYKLIWQTLEKDLKGIKTIYYSPAGLLHRINLSALPADNEEVLADRHRLVRIGSTRQLVANSQEIQATRQDAILFGGIRYRMDTVELQEAKAILEITKNSRGSIGFNQTDASLRGDTWDFLDWTEVEVLTIEALLQENKIQSTLREGYGASEEAFKKIDGQSPHILHVATHGFFFPDPKVEEEGEVDDTAPVFKMSEHPMIRSGLIMAGANHAWTTGKPLRPEMEDGILTAYEISQMDLSNTELVVLSACDTGLGDIEGNEGVYGLQRAFKIAGAKNLIMSLWQVPDYQTQQLMTTFYTKWLKDETSIREAFRAARQEMRKKYTDPFYWAGFVLVE